MCVNYTYLNLLTFPFGKCCLFRAKLSGNGAARISVRGNILGGRPSRGSGGLSPRDARNFWKFPKNFSRKLQKIDYFMRFFKKLKKFALNFRAFWRKTIGLEIFEKVFKNFFVSSTKLPYFGLLSKKFQNPALNFRAFWRKTIGLEIFEKVFKNFFLK